MPDDMARPLRPPSEELPTLVYPDIDDAFQMEDRLEERARIGMPLLDEENTKRRKTRTAALRKPDWPFFHNFLAVF